MMLTDTQKQEIFNQIKIVFFKNYPNGRIYGPELFSFGRHMAIILEFNTMFSEISVKLLIPNSKKIYIYKEEDADMKYIDCVKFTNELLSDYEINTIFEKL